MSWREWDEAAPVWQRVYESCPDASFFLSPGWVDCWLATFGAELNPEILIFSSDGGAIGACLLTRKTEWLRGIPLRRVYLNCAGEDEADGTCIEYNSLLAVPGSQERVTRALTSWLGKSSWDELMLQGTIDQPAIKLLCDSMGEVEVRSEPAHHVAFAPLRAKSQDYLSSLSPKSRHHVRRTRRAFEEAGGECAVRVAQSVDEALEMLRELAALHQARWEARGHAGCFSSAKFTAFHERLIRQNFGLIMIFRVDAGGQTVGLLYCMLHRGWIYHYQSGFCYSLDKRRNPGILTLYLAIEECLRRKDIEGFDFMAGDVEYKRSLSNDPGDRVLSWSVVRRRTPRSLLFVSLRAINRKFKEMKGRNGQSGTEGGESVQPVDGSEPVQSVPVPGNEGH